MVDKDDAGCMIPEGTDTPEDGRVWTDEGVLCLGASCAAYMSRSLKTEWLEAMLLWERGRENCLSGDGLCQTHYTKSVAGVGLTLRYPSLQPYACGHPKAKSP